MKVCGIIAEYNPLHNGHAYHIAQAREKTGCDFVIAAMSGSFVQRGEPAAFDKWMRTRWALQAGADLVLELPAVYCLQSAEGFASGGVKLLNQTSVVTDLCFGSEHEDIRPLTKLASALNDETPEHRQTLSRHLALGKSFPRAQSETLAQLMPEYAHMLASPNFILGLEYIRAIQKVAPQIAPVPVLRIGSGYNDETLGSPLASAKAIRLSLSGGALDESVLRSVPPYVDLSICAPATLERLEAPLLYLLRTIAPNRLKTLHGITEGFENVLISAAQSSDLLSVLGRSKTKRITMARIKRTLCCALLGITNEIIADANQIQSPNYLRVLGFRKSASPLLQKISETAQAPIITRKAQMDALPSAQKKLLDLDIRATDIQALAFSEAHIRVARRDFTEQVVMIE